MVTCILLAAGLSRRFGRPKALAEIHDETVIERIQNTLIQSQVDEIIVVLGASAEQIKPRLLKHDKVKVVYNKDYNFGQTSSFKAGLLAVRQDALAVILMPVDYPLVRRETIDNLIRYHQDQNPAVLIPAYQGQKGHPPVFSIELKSEFLDLDNCEGVNAVAHKHTTRTVILPVGDPGVIATFNSQEEFDLLKAARFDQKR